MISPSILATSCKPSSKWFCPPQFCVGDDFEGPFAPEGYKVTPKTDELFVHAAQLLDKTCEGLLS